MFFRDCGPQGIPTDAAYGTVALEAAVLGPRYSPTVPGHAVLIEQYAPAENVLNRHARVLEKAGLVLQVGVAQTFRLPTV